MQSNQRGVLDDNFANWTSFYCLQALAQLTDAERSEISQICGRCLYHSLMRGYIKVQNMGRNTFVATGASLYHVSTMPLVNQLLVQPPKCR